mgnify:CR=1 FL=1
MSALASPWATWTRTDRSRSVNRAARGSSAGTVAQVRPWLQDFRDYAFDRRIFGVSEVQAQIRGYAFLEADIRLPATDA